MEKLNYLPPDSDFLICITDRKSYCLKRKKNELSLSELSHLKYVIKKDKSYIITKVLGNMQTLATVFLNKKTT